MRTIFSSEQIEELKKNPCVFDCSERYVHYTYEFKVRALDLHAQGVKSREIWRRSGFDTSWWKQNYCIDTLKDWRNMVKLKGVQSLKRVGGHQSDRGPTTENGDKMKRLALQVAYLKAENDFLAKLRAKKAE